MNIIKANNKNFTIIDGGVSVSETEAKFTIEIDEGLTIDQIEFDFSQIDDDIVIYDIGNETNESEVAIYKGYNMLNAIKKNIIDNTIEITITKTPLEHRIKELEDTIAILTESLLKTQD